MAPNMYLPDDVTMILTTLLQAGFQAVVVGGAVRDALRGIEPIDYDIATSATPQEMQQVFCEFHLIPTGLEHGTLTLRVHHHNYEVTTFRSESGVFDHRHPTKVEFIGALKDDLARRDFTINAMAYDEVLHDYYGGQEDLKNGIIRCVGNPIERFTEDALRILRALRFSVQCRFIIEPSTKQAMMQTYPLLASISRERIQVELLKMMAKDLGWVLKEYAEIFIFLFEGLNQHGIDTYLTHYQALPNDLSLHLALLFYHDTELEKDIKSLRLSKQQTNHILKVLTIKNSLISKEDVLIALQSHREEDIYGVLVLRSVLQNQPEVLLLWNDVVKSPYLVKHLAITGDEVRKTQRIKGPAIKEMLITLLIQVALHGLENTKESLFSYLKSNN